MGLVENYLCDYCAKLLYGKSGIAFVKTTYLSFKGSITLQRFNEKTQVTDFIYITDKQNITNPITFCDANCLADFVKHKEKTHDEYMKKRREEESLRQETYGDNSSNNGDMFYPQFEDEKPILKKIPFRKNYNTN